MPSIVAAGRSTARDRHGPACRRQPNTGLGGWPMKEMASSRCPSQWRYHTDPRTPACSQPTWRLPHESLPTRRDVLQPLCYRPLECRPGSFVSDAAGQRTQQQSRRVLSFGRIPAAMCSVQEATGQPRVSISPGQPICGAPTGIEPATPSLPWNHRDRCADRRFPRSRATVGAEVIGSLLAKVCALSIRCMTAEPPRPLTSSACSVAFGPHD